MAIKTSGLILDVAHDFSSLGAQEATPGTTISTEEWDSLLHSSVSDVVFLTWQWQSTWWKHFGSCEGCSLHLLILRDERGALVGLAPLFITSEPLPPIKEYREGEERPTGEGEPKRLVRLVGGIEVADYLDIIATPER